MLGPAAGPAAAAAEAAAAAAAATTTAAEAAATARATGVLALVLGKLDPATLLAEPGVVQGAHAVLSIADVGVLLQCQGADSLRRGLSGCAQALSAPRTQTLAGSWRPRQK